MLNRPPESEVPDFFRGYVGRVPEGPLPEILAGQLASFPALLYAVGESRSETGYAPGKWSLKQSLEHINDTERIMSCRLLRIARGDQTPLPGFEQDSYVANSNANSRAWRDLIAEFEAVRRATLALVRPIAADAWTRNGTASGKPVSARALAYVIAGHVLHHRDLIEKHYPR